MGLTSWYDRHIVPRVIRCACSSPAIMKIRAKVVPLASGDVFEIGCGGGINQQFYDSDSIVSYTGMDPSEKSLEYARIAAAEVGRSGSIIHGCGEDIPLPAQSFDCVVCTFTLCSVADPARAIDELYRLLRPGGRLLYAEHGRAPDGSVARWQDRIEPVWKRLAGGCHLTRPVASTIAAQGSFELEPLGQHYAPKTPRWAGWLEWGMAMKAA